jgi:hypothetical protein
MSVRRDGIYVCTVLAKTKFTFMWACIEKLARGNIIRVDNWVQD